MGILLFWLAVFIVFPFMGLLTFIRWLIKLGAGEEENQKSREAILGKGKVQQLSLERFRPPIEDLYFQKKFSLDTLNEILHILGLKSKEIAPIAPPFASTVSQPADTATVQISQVAASEPAKQSAFLSSSNIKTLLISGSGLFIFSAYLFVRSYWVFIPDAVKFMSLVGMTLLIYFFGRSLLGKAKTPKTAETLIILGLALIPFNVLAANIFVLDHTLGNHDAWSLGFSALGVAAILNASAIPTFSMGVLIASAFCGAIYTGGQAVQWDLQGRLLGVALVALMTLSLACILEIKESMRKGIAYAANIATVIVLILSLFSGFFLNSSNLLPSAFALICIGAIYAIEARLFEYAFAYGAGLCFMGAGVVFLHYFHIPLHKYGLFLVPSSLLAVVRAWTFERAGRKELAAPYFHLGQLAITASLISILPSFQFYIGAGFFTLMAILTLAAISYAAMGVLYGWPLFTYACGFVILLATGAIAGHEEFSFFMSLYLFSGVAWIFLLGGLMVSNDRQDQVSLPLTILGLGTLSLALAFFTARWSEPLLSVGPAHPLLPADQIESGILVGLLCAVAYGLLAYIKKQAAVVYPALVSASLVYIFALEKAQLPTDLVHISWIVPISMTAFYFSLLADCKELARCFGVWAEIIFMVIVWHMLAALPNNGPFIAMVCTLSFVPCLMLGHADLTTAALSGFYLTHFLWFHQNFFGQDISQYAFQLVAINCGVVFLRTLIGLWRPTLSITPFRVIAISFSALSLILALSDHSVAWQVYLAYGLLAIAVSYVHYEGRYLYVGTTLLLAAYELYLSYQHVDLTEAYSAPAGLYLLACGYFSKVSRDSRNFLYAIGQIVLYIPSFLESISETWQWHGIFLGTISIVVMLFGMSERNKLLTFGSLFIVLTNGYVQSRQFFNSLPRWVYLGLGGTGLVTLGGFSEFKREMLVRLKHRLDQRLEQWD